MAIDDTKLVFNSDWEIDQILLSGEEAITFPIETYGTQHELVDFSSLGLTYPPRVQMSWKPQGSTRWVSMGSAPSLVDTYTDPVGVAIDTQKLYVWGTDPAVSFPVDIRYIIYKNKGVTWL